MKSIFLITILFLLFSSATVRAQQPSNDPLGAYMFPPELLMENQQELGLSEEKLLLLETELQQAQAKFEELQGRLQAEGEKMIELVKSSIVDESKTLSQLNKILDLEREIKRTQITLLVKIKNNLTAEQQTKLREIQNRLRGK